MGLTDTILRSKAVAALASPHGVDRYLEQVNPMWAAHEVRARVVDVHREVDVFLCGIAGRGFSDRYLERALGRLRPSLLVPHHHDDFLRPLDATMAPSFGVDLVGCLEELHRLASKTATAVGAAKGAKASCHSDVADDSRAQQIQERLVQLRVKAPTAAEE